MTTFSRFAGAVTVRGKRICTLGTVARAVGAWTGGNGTVQCATSFHMKSVMEPCDHCAGTVDSDDGDSDLGLDVGY